MTLFKKEQNPPPKGGANPPKKKITPLMQPTLINGVTNHSHSNGKLKNKPVKKVSNGNIKEVNHKTKENNNLARPYHWQSDGVKRTSVDDMVLLSEISVSAISENLKKRLIKDEIYTYIGPVLVAVNPFKELSCFGEKEVKMYQGAAQYEVPPHIYALADNMYRNMLIDSDNQCVIISGESGAGKTVSAKFIMNYITRISGGGARVQKVKDVILGSNPLLEAFGNAKTIRNNNSSRFGKYIEIEFSPGGEPQGGRISNFLLEKSRVHFLNENERNFHIFYQLCSTKNHSLQHSLGISPSLDYYNYLRQSGVYTVSGTDDVKDFQETLKAMNTMGIDQETQMEILKVVAAILHMGNIPFVENENKSIVEDSGYLEYPALLLGISVEVLVQKLTSRVFDSKWGSVSERVNVLLNVEQAQFARDAWAKGLYSRLFDYIVQTVNLAMATDSNQLNLGILDIYGFEIFTRNGFEQFCINYVNEKLQQIFIELTLKNEQEEYKQEGIQWKPIDFFNNKIVCDLIEARRPPGIFSVLDDTVATMSAVSEGADEKFRNKMTEQIGDNPHYQPFKDGFTIKHYAGKVDYHIDGFCEKNRDVLFVDIIEVMQQSSSPFIQSLFPDEVMGTIKGRPSTAAFKIRNQANDLVTRLSACVPHYIRCIKPNETQKPKDFEAAMVKAQVEYLGLRENIKVKRAGFAYRRPFEKFLRRYAILAKEDLNQLLRDPRCGVQTIMNVVSFTYSEYQLGTSKCFIKDPESLYMLEEFRERKFDHYARIIQKAFRKYFSKQCQSRDQKDACDVLQDKKRRREDSINRNFYGDYVGVQFKPNISKLIPKREKVEFSETVLKYDRRFRACKRDLILTNDAIYIVGLAKIKKGPQKGRFVEVIKRKINLDNLVGVTLSTHVDNFILLQVRSDFETLLEVNFKTEFLMLLNRKVVALHQVRLPLTFTNRFSFKVKKKFFEREGTRHVEIMEGSTEFKKETLITHSGKTLTVQVKPHLPVGTRSYPRTITPSVRISKQGMSTKKGIALNSPKLGEPHKLRKAPQLPGSHFQLSKSELLNFQDRSSPLRLPSPNQSWPSPGQNATHIVPPPPLEPAPSGQPTVNSPPPLKPKPKPKQNQVEALYSYDARDKDELTFSVGDIFEVIQEDDSGWWNCRFRGREGWCPYNYLQKI